MIKIFQLKIIYTKTQTIPVIEGYCPGLTKSTYVIVFCNRNKNYNV